MCLVIKLYLQSIIFIMYNPRPVRKYNGKNTSFTIAKKIKYLKQTF